MESSSKNLLIIGSIIAIFYLYNYKNPNKVSVKKDTILDSKNNNKKIRDNPTFTERLSHLPAIDEKNVQPLIGKSIGDYLKYFKQFNRQLAREIKVNIKRFDNLKRKISENNNNVYLIQELDNLFFLKTTILNQANSLIYSIDIENCKAEENYTKFNAELKDVLEKAIAKVKQSENEKNKSKNMENDINIFNGTLLVDSEVLPSNY